MGLLDICHTTPYQESHLEPTVLGQTINLRTTNLITIGLYYSTSFILLYCTTIICCR